MATSSRARSSRRNDGSSGNGRSYRIFDDVLAMVGSLANSRKNFAAAKLESLAQSARDFAGAMPDMPNVRAYASVAAESLEGLASYVMDSDLETMTGDAREFARTHPMATLAASIAGGLIVTQMMQMRTSPLSPAAHPASGARRSGGGKRATVGRRERGPQRSQAHA
jgi:hypothetical protein